MFIHYRNKVKLRRLGFGDGFCPICRAISTFDVAELKSQREVYWVDIGRGKHLTYELTCRGCKLVLALPRDKDNRYLRWMRETIERVIGGVGGTPRLVLARAEMEEHAGSFEAPPEVRVFLIAEPIVATWYMLSSQRESKLFQSVMAVVALAAIIMTMVTVYAWFSLAQPAISGGQPFVSMANAGMMAGVTLVLWLLCAARAIGYHKRMVSRHGMERVAFSLAALEPSPEEIAEVLRQLVKEGVEAAKWYDAKVLSEEIGKRVEEGRVR